jgi:hypothetical protein
MDEPGRKCREETAMLRLMTFALAAAAIGHGAVARADESQDVPASETVALVEQLGADLFAAREQAARRLVEIGLSAREALEAATASPDAEVRQRADQVLAVILERDFQARLRAFAVDGSEAGHGLAGWDRFRQVVGDDKAARQLFIQAQRAEGDLLAAVEADPAAAGPAFDVRTRQAYEGLYFDAVSARPSPIGRLAAFLFAAMYAELPVSDEAAGNVAGLLSQSMFQSSVRSGPAAVPLRKLLDGWMERSLLASSEVKQKHFTLATQLGLPEIALRLALELAPDPQVEPYSRSYAILAVARFGGREHAATLAPLLADETVSAEYETDGHRYQCQVRDAALFALLKLTDQSPAEYGFVVAEQGELVDPTALGFTNEADRSTAQNKWMAWAKANPSLVPSP